MAITTITSILLLISIISPSYVTSLDDISSTICPKTRNPSFCLTLLKSAATTDVVKLTTFTLNAAHSNATTALALVRTLAANAADPELKARYSSCSENYDEAVDDIEQAEKDLAAGDYNGVNVAASGVMAHVDDCESNFEQPPADPSLLVEDGRVLEDVCSVVLVLANRLLGAL